MSLVDILYGGGRLSAPSPEACSPAPPEGVSDFIAEVRVRLQEANELNEVSIGQVAVSSQT